MNHRSCWHSSPVPAGLRLLTSPYSAVVTDLDFQVGAKLLSTAVSCVRVQLHAELGITARKDLLAAHVHVVNVPGCMTW